MPKCPNCGNECQVETEEDRQIGYCDPAVIDATTTKPGCDFSFEYKKGKAKSDPQAKSKFVSITESLSYIDKRLGELEKFTLGKKPDTENLTPWRP